MSRLTWARNVDADIARSRWLLRSDDLAAGTLDIILKKSELAKQVPRHAPRYSPGECERQLCRLFT
jgi:hypothetical protein